MSAPPVRPFPLQAGHPANHGYVQCTRCKCWRRDVGVVMARIADMPIVCFDVYGCNRWHNERLARLAAEVAS